MLSEPEIVLVAREMKARTNMLYQKLYSFMSTIIQPTLII
jgi:hypothetical protein